jgi:lipopolysaccharide transport system permease protein
VSNIPSGPNVFLKTEITQLTFGGAVSAVPTRIRIQPSRGWATLNLQELCHYGDLIYFLAWRDVKVRYKQTIIGVAWVLLQPIAMVSIFWLIFGRIAPFPSEGVPYPLYVLIALVPWQFFSRVISESTNSLITDQRLITRVYFPRLVIPIATALTAFVDFSLVLGFAVLLMVWFGTFPGAALLFLPVAIALMLAAALGIGFWLSALNVEYRDVMHAIPFVVKLWFFATPVVYTTSLLPDPWRSIFAINPMTIVVEIFRWCLLGVTPSDLHILVMSGVMAIASFISGLLWFRRRERSFVDSLGGGV